MKRAQPTNNRRIYKQIVVLLNDGTPPAIKKTGDTQKHKQFKDITLSKTGQILYYSTHMKFKNRQTILVREMRRAVALPEEA